MEASPIVNDPPVIDTTPQPGGVGVAVQLRCARQVPLKQPSSGPHTRPQAPQWLALVCVITQAPPQFVYPPLQAKP